MAHQNSDVALCVDTMNAKSSKNSMLWNYYDGDQPLAWTNDKFSEVVKKGAVFVRNECIVVVDTTQNRIAVDAWKYPKDDTIRDEIGTIWKDVFSRSMTKIHQSVLVTGEGYLMVWPDEEGDVKAFCQAASQAHVFYEGADPYTPRLGCKRWIEHGPAGEVWRLNLYYTDRIEHYSASKAPNSDGGGFELGETDDNKFETIPLFQFRLTDREPVGDLTRGVISLQDAINKLLNDMMVSAEYTGWPQRWAIGNFADGKTKVSPGTMVKIPPSAQGDQASAFGTFDSGDPNAYLKPIESMEESLSSQSGTPLYVFKGSAGSAGSALSGEALRVKDGPLVAKVENYEVDLERAWVDAMAFALKIKETAADKDLIDVVWKDPHTMQPETKARTLVLNTQAGYPLKTLLRKEGVTEAELEELEKDMAANVVGTPAPQARAGVPPSASDVQPAFEGVVQTPDIAGEIARTGILARTVARRNDN